jgi:hypothetical protein
VVLNLPATFLVNRLVATGHGLVADDIDLVAVWTDELLQNAADDGCHAGGDDDGGNAVRQRPLEVLVEVRVESDVLDEVVDALREGTGDGVHHLAESIPVREESLNKCSYRYTFRCVDVRWWQGEIYLKVFLPSSTSLLPALRFSPP